MREDFSRIFEQARREEPVFQIHKIILLEESKHVFMRLRFLDSLEMEALKLAIGESHGLTIEQCEDLFHIGKYFAVPGTNFMLYDTGEKSICLAWVLGDEKSFIEFYVHEELHYILHKCVDLKSCCDYDKVAKYAEKEMVEVLVTNRNQQKRR